MHARAGRRMRFRALQVSAAMACIEASGRNCSSTTTAAGLPAKRVVVKESSWKMGARKVGGVITT
jgi:predicted DCC family thiol-disulfide oxidoreductase YuxK